MARGMLDQVMNTIPDRPGALDESGPDKLRALLAEQIVAAIERSITLD